MKKKIMSLILCFFIVFHYTCTSCFAGKTWIISNIWHNKLGKISIIAVGTASIYFISKIVYNHINKPQINLPAPRPPKNGFFKIILQGGEAGEIDNVKRQFNGDKDILELKDVVLYGSYFQISPAVKYGDINVKFQIFTTPSILLPDAEPREHRVRNIQDAHRNIIFFDAENLNIELIYQYVDLCREAENPYIILVPIIDQHSQQLCIKNIGQIKKLFPNITISKNFIVKSNKYGQIKCGYFDQQSADDVRHEILDLNLFF